MPCKAITHLCREVSLRSMSVPVQTLNRSEGKTSPLAPPLLLYLKDHFTLIKVTDNSQKTVSRVEEIIFASTISLEVMAYEAESI